MKTTSESLQELLKIEKSRKSRNLKLVEWLKRASEKGMLEKSEYTLPMKDTIGRNLYKLRN